MTKGEARILELNDITADLMGAGLLKMEVEKPKSEPKAKPQKEPTAKKPATKKKTTKKKSTKKKAETAEKVTP